ncbi:hypothetical protein BH09PSE4_BH09PSE4_06280 [soil metagenome]
MLRLPFLFAAAPFLLADAQPVAIPPQLRTMIDAAFASGNEGEVATVVKYASVAAPDSADAIRALATDWLARRAAARQPVIERAGFLDLWKGRAELGGWMTSGNSKNIGASATLDLARDGPRWRQKVRLQAEYQESQGITNREHYLASYEPNYKFRNRGYAYGAGQYESDHYSGYDNRYSGSLGAGYSAIRTSAVTLNLELGPAYRHTEFTDARIESSLAARGSFDFGWKLSPGLSITQVASAYIQNYDSTITGTTALNARLIGPLSARVSYVVQYESMPPAGRVTTDTTSRASLVYSF